MNYTWKYQIGDQVKSIIHEGNLHPTKMMIFARLTEEHADYTRRAYVCSSYSLGDTKQIVAEEIELLPV